MKLDKKHCINPDEQVSNAYILAKAKVVRLTPFSA